MSELKYDVLGIGNAIVDILVQTEDDFLAENGLTKGAMGLVSAEEQRALYDKTGQAIESSGGSAANTLAGVAALGSRAAFAGKLKDDQLGTVFAHDIRASGVAFETPMAADGAPTATCLVLISPDGQRTMQTYLGACVDFSPADLDPAQVEAAQVTYLEGYLWDPDPAREAFFQASEIAHSAGRKVALSLSDPFCVDRHRDGFVPFIEEHVDILFANEDEILSLYQVDDFDTAAEKIRGVVDIAALTRSEKGSVIVTADDTVTVPAAHVEQVIDTTGAGDAYAAGFLAAHTQGRDLKTSAALGGLLAAVIIQQIGARPSAGVQHLLQDLDG
ncbi:MAG: adenosine kinase [Rhodospirillales bacterium]|nr:adenosine kinase [Rhodospirillales bacterium]MBO6787576.1 adenosine kinase [Rhodospirillales bacterium]